MKRRIAALIRRYGSSVQAVFPDRTEIVRAFLQPVTSRSWQNMDHMIPTGGEVPRGQFIYRAAGAGHPGRGASVSCGALFSRAPRGHDRV